MDQPVGLADTRSNLAMDSRGGGRLGIRLEEIEPRDFARRPGNAVLSADSCRAHGFVALGIIRGNRWAEWAWILATVLLVLPSWMVFKLVRMHVDPPALKRLSNFLYYCAFAADVTLAAGLIWLKASRRFRAEPPQNGAT
jgi:hypothetical protein